MSKTVPFKISEINHGIKEANGLIKLWQQGLELEFEVTDSLLGIFNSGVKNVRISYANLESITFKKGWFGTKVILEGVSMKVFDEIPGTEVATCTLKIERKNREEAQNLISEARIHLSEYKLNKLGESE